MGRPIKLNDRFIQATRDVLKDSWNSLLLDSDLLVLVNEELPPKDQISERTFERYLQKKDNETLSEFCHLIKKARVAQKKNLLKELRSAGAYWQRFAWLLERKYSGEYNLKQEVNHNIEPITININLDKALPTKEIIKIDQERSLTVKN